MGAWIEKISFAAAEPARVALLAGLAQGAPAADEITLAQTAGYLLQQMGGPPLETAVLIKHVNDLAGAGLLERDRSGFRWQLTATGQLVVRQLLPIDSDPPGDAPLKTDEVRAWRDRLHDQLVEDAEVADESGYDIYEVLPGLAGRVAELRVLNRVLGEDRFPEWLRELTG